MIWRPILAGIATLEEIETLWNLTDLLDANEALDIRDDLEREAHEKMKPKGRG